MSWESWGRICEGRSFVEELVWLIADVFLSPDEMPIFAIMVTAVKIEDLCGKPIRRSQESRQMRLLLVSQRRCLLYASKEKEFRLMIRQTSTATGALMTSALDYTNTSSYIKFSRHEAFDFNTMQNDTLIETAGIVAEWPQVSFEWYFGTDAMKKYLSQPLGARSVITMTRDTWTSHRSEGYRV